MTEKEQQFERIYEETKDFGRTQFVREIQMQINDNKKKDKKIKELQKKAELGEHYKHLYSEVKKQKDDAVEYIHIILRDIFENKEYPLRQNDLEHILRMLGEVDVED